MAPGPAPDTRAPAPPVLLCVRKHKERRLWCDLALLCSSRPRIKLYRDKASGMLKGDAVVTYLKEASVQLAVDILDGSYFRWGTGRRECMCEPGCVRLAVHSRAAVAAVTCRHPCGALACGAGCCCVRCSVCSCTAVPQQPSCPQLCQGPEPHSSMSTCGRRHNSSRALSVSPAKFEMKGDKFVPKKKAGQDKVVKKKLQVGGGTQGIMAARGMVAAVAGTAGLGCTCLV